MKINMSDAMYNRLNNTVKLILPALGTFYFTFSNVWGLPYGEQVVGSLAALTVFLGVVLTLVKKVWNQAADGQITVDHSDPTKDVFSLEMGVPLEDIAGKKQITLNVAPQ